MHNPSIYFPKNEYLHPKLVRPNLVLTYLLYIKCILLVGTLISKFYFMLRN